MTTTERVQRRVLTPDCAFADAEAGAEVVFLP
jgi:hypothetical protein